ncbi:hypothetical protein MAR_005224 [Mya arenaria]|uniref:Uncharacterized protein n=1 Tax=Mya arenaria TaxID=6604 RepID=A0ABY7F1A5_MYAAR|nr:hypothetical protein MAR_005224 [Mya arenaria]
MSKTCIDFCYELLIQPRLVSPSRKQDDIGMDKQLRPHAARISSTSYKEGLRRIRQVYALYDRSASYNAGLRRIRKVNAVKGRTTAYKAVKTKINDDENLNCHYVIISKHKY